MEKGFKCYLDKEKQIETFFAFTAQNSNIDGQNMIGIIISTS